MKRLEFYISNIEPSLLRCIGGRPGDLISLIQSRVHTSEEALATELYDGAGAYQNFKNLKGRTRKVLEAYFLMKRARWFMRILCMMPRADFKLATLESMAAKQLENLEQYPVGLGYNMSLEVIPFLPLWRIIARVLD